VVHGRRMRDNGHKMKQSFRLGIWSNFFTARAVKQWSRSPREVVQSTSLEVFKTRLDKALSNLV